jgi:hypothetical protein
MGKCCFIESVGVLPLGMKIQVLKYMFDWCLMPTLAVFQLCRGILKYRILVYMLSR